MMPAFLSVYMPMALPSFVVPTFNARVLHLQVITFGLHPELLFACWTALKGAIRNMKLWAVIAIGFGLCAGLQAETVSPVGGSSHGFSGSGTLYASPNQTGDGSYTITGIDGSGVTGLIGAGGFDGNDNQLRPGASPTLGSGGFAFTDTMGDTDFQVNIFGNADGTYGMHVLDSDGVRTDDSVTFTLGSPTSSSALHSFLMSQGDVMSGTQAFLFSFDTQETAATPEPYSIALVGTGLLGVAGVMRRRFV